MNARYIAASIADLKHAAARVAEEELRAKTEYERLRDLFWKDPTKETLDPMMKEQQRRIRIIKNREKIEEALRRAERDARRIHAA